MIKILLITLFTTTEAFFNLYKPFLLSNDFRNYIKQNNNNFRTSLRSNYLNNLENMSYNNSIPKLLPKPIPVLTLNELPPKPIPIITFDQLFLIIISINHVYMSSNADRIIVEYNNTKGVYYINNYIERNKIEYLLSFIDTDLTIINDYPTRMDNPKGSLYCSPKFSMKANITEEEIEDIINGIIHKYKEEDDDEDEDEDDYDIDLMF